MPQTPLKDMEHKVGEMSEETEYILDEFKKYAKYIDEMLPSDTLQDCKQAINNLSIRLDKVVDALKAVGAKLDSEDVTNLDTDYEGEIDSKLF